MAYQDYGRRVAVLEGSTWYPVGQLRREIRALRGINFSIQAVRDQALQRVSQLGSDAPYSQADRFPDTLWVCEDVGDWSRKFQQLRTALTVKDLSKDPKVHEASHRSSDLSDALQAYHNALTSMSDQITKLDGVFDRALFESQYMLVWVP